MAIYCFDAMFDTESALPDLSQNFETFVLQNCETHNFERREDLRKSYINYYEDVYCPYCEKPRENNTLVRINHWEQSN